MTVSTNDHAECNQWVGHLRAICRGEHPGMSLQHVNHFRMTGMNGIYSPLPPLCALADGNQAAQEQQGGRSPEPVEPLPSILIRGWNFANAMARWTLAGMPRRSQAEIDERLAICQACEFLNNNYCGKCGCACIEENQVINKLALATEKCPEGKWQ